MDTFTLSPEPENAAKQKAGGGCPAATCCGSLDLRLGDCMDVMKTFPDGHFHLAVVDPPYGLGDRLSDGGGVLEKRAYVQMYREKRWDTAPTDEYFEELRRVSKHQIVWGGNYFKLPPTRGIISWDKVQDMPTLSAWEMAWTSFDCVARIYRGRSQDPNRIHPTQKPVDLYKWVFSKYAKPGQRVLDTHLGSGSIAIAAHYAGVHLTACEIDPDYYEAAKARIARETSQTDFFIHHNSFYSYPPTDNDHSPET
jgi:site-specific DNA-methyltransferase (adenine-specific)